MKDTLHVPTLIQWLKDLSSLKSPTNYQLEEAWQLAQTLATLRFPADQEKLDNIRRDIMRYLAHSDNNWNQPTFDPRRHIIAPSARRIKSWTEIELTPELSWSMLLAGKTVPNKLVKSLRAALGTQHNNLKRLLHGAD
jgi:hypothetical protein